MALINYITFLPTYLYTPLCPSVCVYVCVRMCVYRPDLFQSSESIADSDVTAYSTALQLLCASAHPDCLPMR